MFYGISVQVLLVRKRRFCVLRLHLKDATNMRFIGKLSGAVSCLHSPTQFSYKNMRFIGKLIVAMFDKLIILMYKYSITKEQMVWTKEDSNEADKAVSSSQEPLDKEERLLAVTN